MITASSTPSLLDSPPHKKKSILKRESSAPEDTECLLSSTNKDYGSNGICIVRDDSCIQNGQYRKWPPNCKNVHAIKTEGSKLPDQHLPLNTFRYIDDPPQPQSSVQSPQQDSYDDYSCCDSQDVEFSDSVSRQLKNNQWKPWQTTDTSPSDNFDVDGSIISSNSFEHSNSQSSLSSPNLLKFSPMDDIETAYHRNHGDQPRSESTCSRDVESGLPLDTLMNNVSNIQEESNLYTASEASG